MLQTELPFNWNTSVKCQVAVETTKPFFFFFKEATSRNLTSSWPASWRAAVVSGSEFCLLWDPQRLWLLCFVWRQSKVCTIWTQFTGMHCEPVTGDSDCPRVNSEKSASEQWSHCDHWFTLKTFLMFVQPLCKYIYVLHELHQNTGTEVSLYSVRMSIVSSLFCSATGSELYRWLKQLKLLTYHQ